MFPRWKTHRIFPLTYPGLFLAVNQTPRKYFSAWHRKQKPLTGLYEPEFGYCSRCEHGDLLMSLKWEASPVVMLGPEPDIYNILNRAGQQAWSNQDLTSVSTSMFMGLWLNLPSGGAMYTWLDSCNRSKLLSGFYNTATSLPPCISRRFHVNNFSSSSIFSKSIDSSQRYPLWYSSTIDVSSPRRLWSQKSIAGRC